jgi:hypothetical protein
VRGDAVPRAWRRAHFVTGLKDRESRSQGQEGKLVHAISGARGRAGIVVHPNASARMGLP